MKFKIIVVLGGLAIFGAGWAEAMLIQDLQLRVAALERRVTELDNASRPHVTPLTENLR
jgi:hypothetical protein